MKFVQKAAAAGMIGALALSMGMSSAVAAPKASSTTTVVNPYTAGVAKKTREVIPPTAPTIVLDPYIGDPGTIIKYPPTLPPQPPTV